MTFDERGASEPGIEREDGLEGMTFRGPEQTPQLGDAQRVRLREFRKRNAGAPGGPLTEAERQEFLELQSTEQAGKGPLNAQQKAEYYELTRRQIGSENWTPEDANRLMVLQRRVDAVTKNRRK